MVPGQPHFDGGTHCTDGFETLCGTGSATNPCPDPLAGRLLDCGRNDYFATNRGELTARRAGPSVARPSRLIRPRARPPGWVG